MAFFSGEIKSVDRKYDSKNWFPDKRINTEKYTVTMALQVSQKRYF